MTVITEYDFGDEVGLKVGAEDRRGFVTAIMLRPGAIAYAVTWGDGTETTHYAFELTTDRYAAVGSDD